MRISDWSSDVCSSDLRAGGVRRMVRVGERQGQELAAEFVGLHDLCRHHLHAGCSRGDVLLHLGSLLELVAQADQLSRGAAERGGHVGLVARSELVRDQCDLRSEEHTSELQSLMRISYAVFCLKKKKSTS